MLSVLDDIYALIEEKKKIPKPFAFAIASCEF